MVLAQLFFRFYHIFKSYAINSQTMMIMTILAYFKKDSDDCYTSRVCWSCWVLSRPNNVVFTSMRRRNVASTLTRHCLTLCVYWDIKYESEYWVESAQFYDIFKVSKGAKIRNRYNQLQHLNHKSCDINSQTKILMKIWAYC